MPRKALAPDSIRIKVGKDGNLQLDWSYGFLDNGRNRCVNHAVGLKIAPLHWDQKAQQPTTEWMASNGKAWASMYATIQTKRHELFNAYSELVKHLGHIPSPEMIKAAIYGEGSRLDNGMLRFTDWAYDYVERGSTVNGAPFHPRTKSKYRTAINAIAVLETVRSRYPFSKWALGRGPIYVQSFSRNDWADLGTLIQKVSRSIRSIDATEPDHFKGGYYNQSTREKLEDNIKCLLRAAIDEGYTLKIQPDQLRKVSRKPNPKQVLDHHHMQRIIDARLDSPHLENARRLMVIQLMLGHRVGDWERILNAPIRMMQGNGITFPAISFMASKTNADQLVPLFKPAFDVLTATDRPHAISPQKLNDYVKEVCASVGIDEPVNLCEVKANGTTYTATEPLYSVVTTHTFRRSITTLLRGPIFGAAPDIAAIMGGWKVGKEAHWQYARMNPKERAELLVQVVKAGQSRLGFTMIDPLW